MPLPRSVINKLRIRAAPDERAAAESSISRQLGGADLAPPGLPPAAVLLIRSLTEPQPRLLKVTRPDHARLQQWQRGLRGRIEAMARQAARPANGRVPENADAIVFADECEMLACLALHLTAGAGNPWWRRALARYANHPSASSVLRADLDLAPAVIAILAGWNVIDEVIGCVESADSRELARELALQHDLPRLVTAIDSLSGSDATTNGSWTSDSPEAPAHREGRARAASADQTTNSRPALNLRDLRNPFARWLPAGSTRLDIHQQLLVGLALGIRQSAPELRTAHFTRRLTHWLSQGNVRDDGRAEAAEQVLRPSDLPNSADERTAATASGEPGFEVGAPAERQSPALMRRAAPEAGTASPESIGKPDAGDVPAEKPGWDCDGLVTELGGVFCLINVLEHLGLPACFEKQCRLASCVGAFGTLEAIARVLAGTLGEELRHDPIWAVLAAIDGREPNSPPRARGLRSRGTLLPPEWIESTDADFSLALDEAQARAIEALRRDGWSPALLHWLAHAVPYISWRISQACGLPSDSSTRMLLELPARVYVTEAHIDVVASIENIRVPIRLAGLDRSPGWVCSMQRVVLIHFE